MSIVLYVGGERVENNFSLNREEELVQLYERHVNMVYRLCYLYLKNSVDAEDAVQSIFLKLLKSKIIFNDHEHEKAWLIVAAKNYCKDIFKSWWRKHRVDLNDLAENSKVVQDVEVGDVIAKLLALPQKYKIVLYLFYFEEYAAKEIAELLNSNESTVRTQLQRGRERLKMDLGGEYFGQRKDKKSN